MIYVIIPVHNRVHLTEQCLLSLERQEFDDFEVIVIDDGSTDGTRDMIMSRFPRVRILEGDGNLWWAGAMNMGAEYVLKTAKQEDYILTLNDDTVVHRDFVQRLLVSASMHPRSIIGSICLSYEDETTVFEGAVYVNWLTAKYHYPDTGKAYADVMRSRFTSRTFLQRSDFVSGRGTLIPVEAFRDVGLYNHADLPHHGADYEFSRRACLKGYELLIDYKAVLWGHVEFSGIKSRNIKSGWLALLKSFFSFKSPNNLKYRLIFARLCSVDGRFLLFYICDVCRLIIGAFVGNTRVFLKG